MFGALLKDRLPNIINIPKEKIKIIFIVPCTAIRKDGFSEVRGESGIRVTSSYFDETEMKVAVGCATKSKGVNQWGPTASIPSSKRLSREL